MSEQSFKEEAIERLLELKQKQDEAIIQTVEQHSKEEELINQLCIQLDNRFMIVQTQEQKRLDYIELLNKRLSYLYHLRETMQAHG